MTVSGESTIKARGLLTVEGGEPVPVLLAVDATGAFDLHRVLLTIETETGTSWQLELDDAGAAFIAGGLAYESGVTFG